jgi:GT2 family glycosyltransferase
VNKLSAHRLPTVSVIIASYSMERWGDLREAVASVCVQTVPVLETVVVIDHNAELLAQAQRELVGVTVIANGGGLGASAARNTGVAVTHAEVVAFLDDDAIASPHWLEALLAHFSDPRVVGVGGRLDPLWATSRPRWFPPEFDWAVGASYRGMPKSAQPVRNVWGNNMVLRRHAFDVVGGFRDELGKVGTRSSPEDTDLCLRVTAMHEGGIWMYEPNGAADHRAPAARATFRYFAYRCFNEGWGKAALAALNSTSESVSTERSYTRRVLPAAFVRGMRETCQGDIWGGMRSSAIVAGFIATITGFLACCVTRAVQTKDVPRRGSVTVASNGEDIR